MFASLSPHLPGSSLPSLTFSSPSTRLRYRRRAALLVPAPPFVHSHVALAFRSGCRTNATTAGSRRALAGQTPPTRPQSGFCNAFSSEKPPRPTFGEEGAAVGGDMKSPSPPAPSKRCICSRVAKLSREWVQMFILLEGAARCSFRAAEECQANKEFWIGRHLPQARSLVPVWSSPPPFPPGGFAGCPRPSGANGRGSLGFRAPAPSRLLLPPSFSLPLASPLSSQLHVQGLAARSRPLTSA